MTKAKEIRTGVKSFLTNIPDDQASHNALFGTIENTAQSYSKLKNADILGSLTSGFNAFYHGSTASSFGYAIPNIAWLYRNIDNPNFLQGLVDNGLFEELNESPNFKNKAIGLVDSFINSANTPEQKAVAKINQLTKEEQETPAIANEKKALLKNMGPLAQVMINYRGIANDLNDEDFLKTALSKPEILKDIYSKLNKFITLDEKSPEVNNARKEMIGSFVELATNEDVRKTLTPLANGELVDHIFNLPTITPAVKTYHKLVKDLSKDEKEFQHLFGTLVAQDQGLKTYINDLMDFIDSPEIPDMNDKTSAEYIAADKTFDQSMISLVDAIKPDVIEAAIPLIDDQLIENILNLPNVKAALNTPETEQQIAKKTKEIQNDITAIVKDPQKMIAFQEEFGKEAVTTLLTSLASIDSITPKLNEIKEPTIVAEPIKATKPSPIMAKTIEMINGLAANPDSCAKLSNAFKDSKKLEPALNKLIAHPVAGKALSDFCLTGKDVAEFLPKVCTEKGLKAVASYVEKPTTLKLINIFVQTNTLGFAVKHFTQSLMKTKTKEAPENLLDKTSKTLSIAQKIIESRASSKINSNSLTNADRVLEGRNTSNSGVKITL